MKTTATTLGSKMDVHREESVFRVVRALTVDDLPLCDEGFATCGPCFVSRIDAARVVLQSRTVENFVCVKGSAWVRLVQSDE
jgi:hypothetical protein